MKLVGEMTKTRDWWNEDEVWAGQEYSCHSCGSIWKLEARRDIHMIKTRVSRFGPSPTWVLATIMCQTCGHSIDVYAESPEENDDE